MNDMNKYGLEYRFIPSLVDAFNRGDIPVQALFDIAWWEDALKKMGNGSFDFSFDDIKAEPRLLQSGTKAILYSLPEADVAPLAKYAAVLMRKDGKGQYITFEKDMDPEVWFLGGQEGEVHSNYGEAPDCPSLDDFAALLEERFLGAGKRMAGFLRRLFK